MKDKAHRQLAIWLYFGALCVFIQILLGGITRLTGSGLSITEWQPLLGAIPPLNNQEWQHSFSRYQEIAQFKKINSHFSLADYQMIYFWEWLHRNWARAIGLIFIIPFVIFLFQRKISIQLFSKLILLLPLGALQALIGWIMVKSGLNDTSIAVDEVKLALHLIMAVLLLSYILWMAFRLSMSRNTIQYNSRAKRIAAVTLSCMLIQIYYGALMAGSKAALAAPTWPDMNGFLIPPELTTSHLLSVQFIHRMLAYLSAILVLILYRKTEYLNLHKKRAPLRHSMLILVCLQIFLGITALLNSFHPSYRTYAILHQGSGILLFMNVLLVFYHSSSRTFSHPAAERVSNLQTGDDTE